MSSPEYRVEGTSVIHSEREDKHEWRMVNGRVEMRSFSEHGPSRWENAWYLPPEAVKALGTINE